MDNAFLSPILSALGRTFLSRYNRGKKVNSNIQRMPLLIVMAWGCWIVSLGSLGFLIYFYIRFNQLDGYCMGVLAVAPLSGLLFYVWYRNAYVEITRTYVLRRDLLRRVQKVHFKDVNMFRAYGNREESGIVLFSDSSAGTGSVLVSSVQASLAYIQAQMVFRMEQERWADADSDDDQDMLRDYMRSGQAWEMVMSSGGANFPENDKKASESSSDEGN